MTPYLESCRVLKKKTLTPEIYSIYLDTTKIAKTSRPGQFVNIRFPFLSDPYLRRPFAIADAEETRIRIIFRVRGKGTFLLSQVVEDTFLSVLGPLGNPIPEVTNEEVALIGGGIGLAPFFFLAKALVRQNKVSLFLGAKTGQELIMPDEFSRLGIKNLFLATENGEIGERGKITELIIKNKIPERAIVFASGPIPMYQELRKILPNKIYAFFEERMGCGTGLCLSCVIKKRVGGYLHLCQDGPVLDLDLVKE